MRLLGHVLSGLGVVMYVVGIGYWLWYFLQKDRIRILRRKTAWGLLSNFTVLGMLVLALGQALVTVAQRR